MSAKYATFSFKLPNGRHGDVPVGVALWDSKRNWFGARLVNEQERPKGISKRDFMLLSLARENVETWKTSGELPYAARRLEPSEDGFWEHVRKLLVHRVRLSEPHAIDAPNPGVELNNLFDSLVAVSARKPRERK